VCLVPEVTDSRWIAIIVVLYFTEGGGILPKCLFFVYHGSVEAMRSGDMYGEP